MEFPSLGNLVMKSKQREKASGDRGKNESSQGKRLILIHKDVLLRNCLVIIVFAIFISWGWGRAGVRNI